MLHRLFAGCVLLSMLVMSCNGGKTRIGGHGETSRPEESVAPVAESTRQMAARISAAFNSINPANTAFHTSEARIQYFRQLMQQGSVPERINAWQSYANELLNAGHTEEAIGQLEPLITEVSRYPNTDQALLQLRRLLAVAYLRIGEQANCINERTPSSCIVPILPEAQYRMTQGSKKAMQICREILATHADEQAIWLLNLAAMTIGQYPDSVPGQWRIAPEFIYGRADFPAFRDISLQVGIHGKSLAGGASMEDFDGDGWLDILTSSWGPRDPLVLWKNTGDGKFVDASSTLQLDGITGGLNMIHGDINNDGRPDVFVMRGAWLFGEGRIPNSLLLNLGEGRFADVTETAGVLAYAPTQTAVFADFNLDGWLDLFVGNESTPQSVYSNELYLNTGSGHFRNVIGSLKVNTTAMVKGCAAGDINHDGWPDLYLSNYAGDNMLLLNLGPDQEGVPQFKEIAAAAGVTEPQVSFPVWFFDYDNDGWEDIFVSSYGDGTQGVAKDFVKNARGEAAGHHPRVYRNLGDLTFREVSQQLGLRESVYTMGCNFGDLDGDGFLDFYLGTGNPEYTSIVPNKMYHNQNGKKFEDVTGAGRFGQIQKGHAVAFGDFDRDGDEDFFESLGGAFAGDVYEDVLFENPIGQEQAWVVLVLEGVTCNRSAIGARVEVQCRTPSGQKTFYRTCTTGGSFGASSLQLEIGLGDATAIKSISVTWPVANGQVQIMEGIEMRRYIRIMEGAGFIYQDSLRK